MTLWEKLVITVAGFRLAGKEWGQEGGSKLEEAGGRQRLEPKQCRDGVNGRDRGSWEDGKLWSDNVSLQQMEPLR